MAAYTEFLHFRKAVPENRCTHVWVINSLKMRDTRSSLFSLLFKISSKNISIYKLFIATFVQEL